MARLGRALRQRAVITRSRVLALANTGGGQPDETVVSIANSSAGGAPWDVVSIGADATFVYDAVAGNTWYRIATGATTTVARADWTSASLSTGWARYFGRAYFRIPAASLGTTIIYLVRARSGAVQSSRISVSTGNRIQLRNTGNSSAAQGAVDIAADTTYRLEWDITVGAAAPGVVHLYAGDSTTPLETITAATADFGTGLVNELGFGMFTSVANHPIYWMRGFQVNDTSLPGPLGDLAAVGSAAGADTVTLTDSATAYTVRARDVAETVTLADTVERGAVTMSRDTADQVAVEDAAAATTVRARGIADAVTVLDSTARAVAYPRGGAEAVQLADQVARSPFAYARAVGETLVVADTAGRLVAVSRAITDAVTLVDAVARGVLAGARAPAETVQLVDGVQRGPLGMARAVAEAVSLADEASAVSSTTSAGVDTVSLADAVTRGFLTGARAVAEVVSLSDVADRVLAVARSGAEAIALLDEVAAISSTTAAGNDGVALADVADRGPLTAVRGVTEALQLDDQVQRGPLTMTRAVAEAVTVADAAAAGGIVVIVVHDQVQLVDTVARAVARARAVAEAVTLADSATATIPAPIIVIAYPHSIVDTSRPATIRRTV